ncbi:MAG: transcription termination/antitermination NusG family protein [Gemmataceae bacterium]
MISDDIPNTEPTAATTDTVEAAHPAPVAESEPAAAEAPPEPVAEASTPVQETAASMPATATPAPPTDHATATAAEAVPSEMPTSMPAESAPEAAIQSAPTPAPEPETEPPATTPKKPKKAKAAPAAEAAPGGEVAGADIAAVLGSSSSTEEAPAETDETPTAAEGEVAPVAATGTPTEPAPESKKRWYAVKIQSGREESIKAAIERKIKIEGLEEYYGQIVIPVEEVIVKKKVKVKNKKTGETTTQEKNVTKYNKKFPGYLFAEVEFNNDILYVFRETSGVGDFVGVNTKKTAGAMERSPPAPMTDEEVKSMLTGAPSPDKKRKGGPNKVVVKLEVEKGDKVRIRNGAFAGNEGEVKAILEAKDPTESPKVTVEVTIWGRPVPIDLDYWEVDKV